ncbi:hypothetical protein KY285_020355 [Solanum tuberosum]|nr:hypothetical protein KY289_020599 [Solanum tuberosum]KAH0693258.1 hypothetical protein KY285_020355 [Solanum tuberosum]
MVTETPNLLRVWWNNLNAYQKIKLSIHLGHLLSIMNLKVWPKFIEVVTRFWDDERMAFCFRYVEMTPTVEEIKDCLDNVEMYQKRKNHPDHHILLPDKPTSLELKNMSLLGAKCPVLILPGIRGLQPYNPSRVMLQFGRTQILPFKGDTSHYVFDYNGCDKIPYAKDICQEWAGQVNIKESMTKNRYEAGYVDEYKKWLQNDLHGTLDLTPRTGRQIEDVQLSTLRSVAMSSKAVFAEPHLITSKLFIREEVEKAKGGAGPSTL